MATGALRLATGRVEAFGYLRPSTLQFASLCRQLSYRGARIRTGDLADPNGARYQAAPRPDAPPVSHTALRQPDPALPAGAQDSSHRLLRPTHHAARCAGYRRPSARGHVRPPRRARPPARARPLQRLLRQRPAGTRARPGGHHRHRRVRRRAAVRARRRRACRPAARPPRASSGPPASRRSTPCSHAACNCCSTPTSRSPPTTCRSTPIPNSETTRCSAHALGAEQREPFALHHGQPIGCLATLPGDGMPADHLFARVREITAREPLVLGAGPARVRRLAIVSGAGADYLADAAAAGADALLTGEVAERADGPRARARFAFDRCRATTQPRRSACSASASMLAAALPICATSSLTSQTLSKLDAVQHRCTHCQSPTTSPRAGLARPVQRIRSPASNIDMSA